MNMKLKNRAHCAAGGLLSGSAVLYAFPPAEHSFYPRCIFHALTGLQCPGCGGTRALYYLLHFNVAQAMHYNALVTLAAPVALAYFLLWYCQVLRSGRGTSVSFSPSAMACLYLVVLLFGITRNFVHFP